MNDGAGGNEDVVLTAADRGRTLKGSLDAVASGTFEVASDLLGVCEDEFPDVIPGRRVNVNGGEVDAREVEEGTDGAGVLKHVVALPQPDVHDLAVVRSPELAEAVAVNLVEEFGFHPRR